jgi:uncharacterized protein YabE (DUF348 family)
MNTSPPPQPEDQRRRVKKNKKTTSSRRGGFSLTIFFNPIVLSFFLISGLLAMAFAVIYTFAAPSVTLVIDGVRREVRTRESDVAAILRSQGILLEAEDILSPAAETSTRNGLLITLDKANQVAIEADGTEQRIRTHETLPQAILQLAGVTMGEHDVMFIDGQPFTGTWESLRAPRYVRIVRAVAVSVRDGDEETRFFTVANTVAQALSEAQVALYVADRVQPALDAPLPADGTIAISRAKPFSVLADGRTLQTRAYEDTVGEALISAGVPLLGLDYTVPDESTPLTEGMLIRVVRVTERDDVKRTEIDFESVYQSDDSIPPDTERIIQQGSKGLLETRTRVRLENGVEVSRDTPRLVVVRTPQNALIAVGATPALLPTDLPNITAVPDS